MSAKNAIIMGSAITITIFHCSNYLQLFQDFAFFLGVDLKKVVEECLFCS